MNDDELEKETSEGEESFAELFESYSAGMNENINVGERIRGRIISIGGNSVFVDTGTKVDGVVERSELLEDDGELSLGVGDELDLYVVAADESEIRLSKAVSGIGGLNMLRDAWEQRIPVEGKVAAAIKGGFHVEVVKRRAFCPISQMDVAYVEDPGTYVGQTFTFLIKRFEENGRNIVLSRREILEKELDISRKAFMAQLTQDAVFEGSVVRLVPFGAFVSLAPGVEGLVHISEMSYTRRVMRPEEVVSPGDAVMVTVKEFDLDRKRISLSIKDAEGDPWADIEETFKPGQTVQGRVEKKESFGIFVNLAPGITGLLPKSKIAASEKAAKFDSLKPGGTVSVTVDRIDTSARKISLGTGDVADNQGWQEFAGSSGGSMGSLGDQLQKALSRKKKGE